MKFVDKDLLSVQEARILMEHAEEARKALALFDQEKLGDGHSGWDKRLSERIGP